MRSFLGILCIRCRAYFRIYQDPSGKTYEGRCPRCGRTARALIDNRHGTRKRFFIAR